MPDTGDTRTTVVMVADDGTEVTLERIDARRADLALIDALARLQLGARRRGAVLRVHHPSDELCALLELVGLADILGDP